MSPSFKVCILLSFCGLFGLSLICFGSGVFFFYSEVKKNFIASKLKIKESDSYLETWLKHPISTYMKFYFYNVTNPTDIINKNAKPSLREIGPYTFEKLITKEIVSHSGDVISYKEYCKYIFLPDLSAGDQSEKIFAVNLPLLAVEKNTDLKAPPGLKEFAFGIVESTLDDYDEELFVHRTINELLFGGYKVPSVAELLDLARSFLGDDEVPDVLPDDTFGIFYGKNNSNSGNYSIYTGESEIENYGKILIWNNNSYLSFWKDKYCNMINGSDGFQFSPFVKKSDTLYVFVGDICRSVYYDFEKDFFARKLPVYRFVVPNRLFHSASENENNKCFCSALKSCDVSGLTPIGPCYMDVPLVASAPHFYQGDSFLWKDVEGLQPIKQKHESFIDIEPMTGTVIKNVRRVQINVDMRKSKYLEIMKSIPEVIFPVLWISEEFKMNDSKIDQLYWKIFLPLSTGKVLSLSAMTVGCTSLLLSIISWCFLKNQNIGIKIASRNRTKINNETGNELQKF